MTLSEIELIEALAMKACAGSSAVSLPPGKLLALCFLAKMGASKVEEINREALRPDND